MTRLYHEMLHGHLTHPNQSGYRLWQMDLPAPDETPTHLHRLPVEGGRGVYCEQAAKQDADGERISRFILYSGKEVRYNPMWQIGGDVIATREFRLAAYRRNPVVLAEHNPETVVGRGDARIVTEGELTALHFAVEWDRDESNPVALLVAGQHFRGFRRAVSVGFMPGKGSVSRAELPADHPYRIETERKWAAGWFYRHPEMYEGSSVSIPKDPDALQIQHWAMEAEDPDERLRRAIREVLATEAAAVVLQAVRQDPQIRTAIEGVALGSLPRTTTEQPADPASDWFESWT
jgi:phage head maturation protease